MNAAHLIDIVLCSKECNRILKCINCLHRMQSTTFSAPMITPAVASLRRATALHRRLPSPLTLHRCSSSFADAFVAMAHTNTLTRTFESCLLTVHDVVGLDWTATIVVCTFSLRMLGVPLAIFSEQLKARRQKSDDIIAKKVGHYVTKTCITRRRRIAWRRCPRHGWR